MTWNELSDISQLDLLKLKSQNKPIVIFKHSTRCSISSTALDRFERAANKSENNENADFYYLDLIKHRDISNKIATEFEVEHESPQLILIKGGKAIYIESQYGINFEELQEKVN